MMQSHNSGITSILNISGAEVEVHTTNASPGFIIPHYPIPWNTRYSHKLS